MHVVRWMESSNTAWGEALRLPPNPSSLIIHVYSLRIWAKKTSQLRLQYDQYDIKTSQPQEQQQQKRQRHQDTKTKPTKATRQGDTVFKKNLGRGMAPSARLYTVVARNPANTFKYQVYRMLHRQMTEICSRVYILQIHAKTMYNTNQYER